MLFQNNFIIYYIILVFVCYCFVCVALFRFAQIKYKSNIAVTLALKRNS